MDREARGTPVARCLVPSFPRHLMRRLRAMVPVLAAMMLVGCAPMHIGRLVDFTPTIVTNHANFDTIAEYASYAQAAYWPDEEIMQAFPDTVRINTPGENAARYFLEVSPADQTQTISVRGTHTFRDILHDIEFQLVPDFGSGVVFHRGFETAARLIYEDVKPHLNPNYRTRLTGHSLGAAVSAILLIYLQQDGYLVERSINFGQPKFTNVAGANLYSDLPLQRVVDANDVVPMLPPQFFLHPLHGAYAHVGEEVILLDGPYFGQLNDHDAERISIDQFWRDRDFASRADHHMARYLERIENKEGQAQLVDYRSWQQLSLN